jgi:ATP adenylyltransferase
MDFLWSPWRYEYVSRAGRDDGCVFCLGDPGEDARRLVLHRGTHCFVILNLYPYTSGHLMVAPYAHIGSLEAADPFQMGEMFGLARRATGILGSVYSPEGFNVGMNLGACAGAGIRDHIHLHVVPRWCGDVNFMTSTAETRVLPEALETTYGRLAPLFRDSPA